MRSRSPLPADDQPTPTPPQGAASPTPSKGVPAPASGNDAPPRKRRAAKSKIPTVVAGAPGAPGIDAAERSDSSDTPRQPIGVLIVDDEPSIREALATALQRRPVRVHVAATLAEARQLAQAERIDVALVDVRLPDGDGLDLAGELRAGEAAIESIVMTGRPSVERAISALRAGAADFLSKPFDLAELDRCVDAAMQRRADHGQHERKIAKLRKLCRKLNRARHDVTQQVDILCNDLVTAYQELAGQMRHVQMTTQFQTTLEQELDLEQVLRRCLEFVLAHIGPTNAVVFLPGRSGAHTVGGYINYTFDKQTADVLLGHLADVAAPRIGEQDGPMHLRDNAEINLWLSDDSAWLADCEVLALPCRGEDGDVLASLLLFRDANDVFTDEHAETLSAIAPLFARQLVKVISIHHRHRPDEAEGDDADDEIPF